MNIATVICWPFSIKGSLPGFIEEKEQGIISSEIMIQGEELEQ